MRNQKAISVRMNVDTLFTIDSEVSTGSTNRNRFINDACRAYNELIDLNRYAATLENPKQARTRVMSFLIRWSPKLFTVMNS